MSNALVAKYGDARLPRYTSYPTAPAFTPVVGAEDYAQGLAGLDKSDPVSIYLHVPFCREMCWYCGCHTSITRQDGPVEDYIRLLTKEMELVALAAGNPVPVKNVHFGGGTPTIMTPIQFRAVMDQLRTEFVLAADCSVAIEIDPRTLSSEMIGTLGDCGVDRASLGVQSFDPVVQRAINRVQTIEETEAAVAGLRAQNVSSINFDLIYGLPHQTVQSCLQTVRSSLELRPERFAVFGYAHVPSFKKHQRLIDEAVLPGAEERNEQAEAIAEELVSAGYMRIGLDHFALPDDEMAIAYLTGRLHRNFQGYTADDCNTLIGLGASAIGRLPSGFIQNQVPLGRYAECVSSGVLPTAKGYRMTQEDKLRGKVIERLMCDFKVDLATLCREAGFREDFLLEGNARLEDLAADGVVSLTSDGLEVSHDCRFMVRAVAAAFDAYLGSFGRTHSKAA